MRVGDADREAARVQLVEAYAAGQLDTPELESRAARVLGAGTATDLEAATSDLREEPVPPGGARSRLVRDLLVFLICSTIAIAIWHLTGRGFFWPVWVIVYTGLSLPRFLDPRSANHT